MDKYEWFRNAKFGLMVHWGLYCLPAGEWKGQRMDYIGEWIQAKYRIAVLCEMEDASQFSIIIFLALAHCIVARYISLIIGNEFMVLTIVVCRKVQLDRVAVIDAIQTASLKSPRLVVQVVIETTIGIFCLYRTVGKFPVIVTTGIERQLVVGLEGKFLVDRIGMIAK